MAPSGGVPAPGTEKFDLWASDYDSSQLQSRLYEPVHQAVIGCARRYVPHPETILDVGCGTGRLLRAAGRSYPRARLLGVDASAEMIRRAEASKRTGPDAGHPAIGFVHASAERLPLRGRAFGLVLCTMSLRHWQDQACGLTELARVMTPDAVFVIADALPSAGSRPGPARRRGPCPEDLREALAVNDLRVIHSSAIRSAGLLADITLVAATKALVHRALTPALPERPVGHLHLHDPSRTPFIA